MANFKLYSVAAVLAFAGIASAQTPAATCTISAPYGANIIRAEGTTEYVGDVAITCTGGAGGQVTLQVTAPPTTSFTGRITSTSTNATEAFATVNGAAAAQGVLTNPTTLSFTITLAGPNGGNAAANFVQFSNLRINASAIGAAAYSPVNLTVFGISQLIQVSQNTTVAYVISGLNKATTNGSTSASSTTGVSNPVVCQKVTAATPISYIHFSEGFPQSFKTAYATGASEQAYLAGTTTAPSTTLGSYLVNNTEAGVSAFGSASIGYPTSGTRVTVTLANLPAGTVWLPVSVQDDLATTGTLQLIASPTGTYSPVAASTSSSAPNKVGAGLPSASFSPVNGVVTATYEVIAASASVQEAFSIPVYISYSANTVAATGVSTAQVSFAPTGTTNFPNFAASSVSPTNSSKFNTCTTTLLFPYVVNSAGFDTGLTIANTSVDNFSTVNQNGSCVLYWYSGAAGSTGNTATPSFTVNAGVTYANLLSVLNPGFTGYAIAQCTFQFAHGFAFITDGFASPGRGLSQGYLALVLADPNQINGGRGAFGSPTGNAESSAH